MSFYVGKLKIIIDRELAWRRLGISWSSRPGVFYLTLHFGFRDITFWYRGGNT